MCKIYYNPQTNKIVAYDPHYNYIFYRKLNGISMKGHYLNIEIAKLGYHLVGEL